MKTPQQIEEEIAQEILERGTIAFMNSDGTPTDEEREALAMSEARAYADDADPSAREVTVDDFLTGWRTADRMRPVPAPTDHVKEAIYDGAEFVCVTYPRNSYGAQVAWEHAHPEEREALAMSEARAYADDADPSAREVTVDDFLTGWRTADRMRPAPAEVHADGTVCEPTDAQVIAARDELQRHGYARASLFAMRSALIAAFKEV